MIRRGDNMKMKIVVISVIVCLFVLASGCVEVHDEADGEVESKMSFTEIRVGDIPTEDFSHVNITFSEIKLHSNETGWSTITSEPKTVDLIYLHLNNLTEQLGIEEIEIGNYTKLWIVIDNATGILKATNETVYFDVPSETLKIQHLFDFREGSNTITVDIDLDNSVVELGHGEVYKLLPVIGALRVQYENGTLLRIRDQDRLRNMTGNRAPAIDIVVNNSRDKHVTVDVNESITFNASGTYDVESDTITFTWDFGDETNDTGAVVTHSYSESGTYQVTLTVSDGELEDTAKITITVKQSGGQGNGPG